ncbi:hypothetical protein HanXRQr2_Chr08g0334051 [Helianthus annuus]|uniref:Uncharacterized protein n=1 Tax=Helianthus annuus TaxID=4232 RepID=A0A251U4T0_HELAN|nr:hypothetical protein HanXRQr2_Chr08g0334051 [Helianthus annuus]
MKAQTITIGASQPRLHLRSPPPPPPRANLSIQNPPSTVDMNTRPGLVSDIGKKAKDSIHFFLCDNSRRSVLRNP